MCDSGGIIIRSVCVDSRAGHKLRDGSVSQMFTRPFGSRKCTAEPRPPYTQDNSSSRYLFPGHSRPVRRLWSSILALVKPHVSCSLSIQRVLVAKQTRDKSKKRMRACNSAPCTRRYAIWRDFRMRVRGRGWVLTPGKSCGRVDRMRKVYGRGKRKREGERGSCVKEGDIEEGKERDGGWAGDEEAKFFFLSSGWGGLMPSPFGRGSRIRTIPTSNNTMRAVHNTHCYDK